MAADKMPLEGDNSYGFKRGVGKDYFGGAPGITTIRFDGGLTLSDFKIRLEGGDLVFYLIDPANPNQPLSEIADVFYFDNWIANDHGIERFEFSDGTTLSKIAVQSDGRLKLYGSDGDDTFVGTSGRDEIYGSEGADTIDGKGGTDIINYLLSDAGVTVNLTTGQGSGGYAEGDQISNVESIIGSYHDDVLIGDDGNNNLFAQNGNDHLEGGGGDDWLNAYGSGADYLDGGSGNDTVRYRWSRSGVTVNLADQSNNAGDAAGDVYVSIENVMGSNSYGDHITGDAGDNKIWGYGGNDTLDGGDGNDTILGGNGNDVLKAGNGDDYLDGGAGDDEFHYGEGTTTFRYDLGDGNDIIHVNHDVDASYNDKVVFGPGISPADVTVTRQGEGTDKYGDERDNLDLLLTFKDGGTLLIKEAFFYGPNGFAFGELHFSDGTIWNWESFNKMRFENASDEAEELVGTLGDDVIDGRGGDDKIDGYSGDDHLIGGAGNDTLQGHDGDDHLEGGVGNDKLRSSVGNNILDGGDGNDTIESITDGVDQIIGGSGDDTIFVRYGSAIVNAGTGDDTLNISLADVTLHYNLGDGNDVVDFWYPEKLKNENHRLVLGEGILPDEVVITRTSATSTSLLLTFKDGGTLLLGQVMDRYTLRSDFGEIEFADGTVWNWENINQKLQEHISDGNDVVGGTSGNDIIDGMGGDDTIYGGAGDDVLSGGDGNDDLKGGAGNDQLSSGKGDDYLDGGDGDDVLAANGIGSAQLHGGNGDDTLYHIQGSSILNGGSGNDTIHYFGGEITVQYGVGDGDDIIQAGGLAGPNNKLMLVGAKPDEVLLRHAGSDSIEFTFSDGGTLLLENGFFQSSEKLLFSEIQFLDGTVWTWDDVNQKLIDSAPAHAVDHGVTEGDDIINGTVNGDIIKGLAGDDVIDGGAGRDFIFAGDGNDTIKGGDDKDILSGGDGDDHISGGADDDNINGGAGDDQIFGGEGNDYLSGGEGDDIVKGGAGNDQLSGGPGNDTLDGGDGDDVISANHDGNSTLIGGAGNDKFYTLPSPTLSNFVTVEGGTGDDILEYIGGEVSFHYDLGDGNDTIRTSSVLNPHSKIVFGEGILPDEVAIERLGNTESSWSGLQYTFKDGGSIVITTAFTSTPGELQFGEIQFADGTVWNWEDIHKKLLETASNEGEILWGTNGNDVINGLGGDDVIDSVEGDNQINGGTGNDIITSGYGDDTIIFGDNFGNDTLIDFHVGESSRDIIQFSDGVFKSFEDVMSAARQEGLDTVIQLDQDNSITLQHVNVSHLHADDFAFVS